MVPTLIDRPGFKDSGISGGLGFRDARVWGSGAKDSGTWGFRVPGFGGLRV